MKTPVCAVVSVLVFGLSATGAELNPTAGASRGDAVPSVLFVDGARGNDQGSGDEEHPCKSLSGALSRLPEVLQRTVTIHLATGAYTSTGGVDMPTNCLVLMRRMRPGVEVRFVGHSDASGHPPVFAWEEGAAMVQVTDGDWWLESIQVGSGTLRQRRGVMVQGPGHVTLKNVTCRTRSLSDAGIYAHRGGKASLRGTIRLNEHLHESAGQETFSGIIATDHGLIRFAEREGALLSVGNGSLSASYYGVIELGCETARITSWTEQGNCLAVNNSGRIDLHNTRTTLCAARNAICLLGLSMMVISWVRARA